MRPLNDGFSLQTHTHTHIHTQSFNIVFMQTIGRSGPRGIWKAWKYFVVMCVQALGLVTVATHYGRGACCTKEVCWVIWITLLIKTSSTLESETRADIKKTHPRVFTQRATSGTGLEHLGCLHCCGMLDIFISGLLVLETLCTISTTKQTKKCRQFCEPLSVVRRGVCLHSVHGANNSGRFSSRRQEVHKSKLKICKSFRWICVSNLTPKDSLRDHVVFRC